jgi:hypothetical protein
MSVVADGEDCMERLLFRQLPWAVRIAVGLAIGLTWVFIEEHIIEPLALYKYMPFYRVGNFCIYDFTVGMIIAAGIWRASRHGRPPAARRVM